MVPGSIPGGRNCKSAAWIHPLYFIALPFSLLPHPHAHTHTYKNTSHRTLPHAQRARAPTRNSGRMGGKNQVVSARRVAGWAEALRVGGNNGESQSGGGWEVVVVVVVAAA